MTFEEKYVPCYLLTDQMSLSGCLYFMRYWVGCDVINFKMYLIFLMKLFFPHEEK